MRDAVLFCVIVGGLVGMWAAAWSWRRYRWYSFSKAPFPESWLSQVRKALPFYDYMSVALQDQLQAHTKQFLFTKRFVGCAGLVVTDEMRITIAACASLLLLNRPTFHFRNVRWIYLYPAEFVVRHTVRDAAGVVSTEHGVRSGEAWHNGRVILSWDDVHQGVYDFNDGRNVVLHEFAHQLDAESGSMNGAPLLRSKGAYGSWATILSREFNSLREHAYFGADTVLDTYGATNPAEFFAVATESFFEEPDLLSEEHPELFTELLAYYQVDPREWRPKVEPRRVKAEKEKVKH